jgi:predicted nucleotidyltransferase
MGRKKIQTALDIFTLRAQTHLGATRVVLFGSFARGEANSYSDVDVVVVSKKFFKMPFDDRLDLLYPLVSDLPLDFHPFGFTPWEFAHPRKTSTLSEIKKEGLNIL